ncbi:MAG TPA: PD-(D/E)XK nuclease family protein, partial [Polyangia bacterium]|nr:PD-(D/E)XK nuclease family protein [Polyangia bacterium]
MATLCDGILNVHFLMPGEMALKLGERALVSAGRRPLPPLADRILLRQIAADQPGYFEPVGQAPGFADALHRLVRELRAAGLEPEEFSASLADACEVPEKAEALAAIYERFLELRSEFFGPDDALLAAEFENPPWTELHAVGLTNPPVALRAALAGLAEHIPVTAYLPTTDTEADVATLEFRDWLTSVGATVDAAPPPTAEPTTLSHARDGLFAEGPSEAPTLDGTLRLLSAPDPTREIREVARTCLEWARAGVNFHEMAIAYRHPDTYRATIEAVFQEAGIPLYLHEGSPLIERPLGRRIMSLLELTEDRFERRAVIEFLSEARLPDETWKTYERFHSSRWDRVSRDAGIVEGRKQWEDRLTATILDLESRDDQERWKHSLADTLELRKFMRDLMAAIDALPARGSWGQHLEALTALLRTYVKDADPVLDALEGMQRVDALGSEVGAEEFRELVRSALEGMRSDDVRPGSSGAFGRRGVNVLDVNSLQLLRFKAVAIVGLVERSFPSPPRPDPLLLDPERINLNAASGKPLQLRVLGPDTEPLQFSLATAAAGEQLLVTFPRKAQGEAKPQLPSPYFRAVAEAVVGHNVAISAIDTLPPALFTRAAGSRIGAADLATALSLPERDRTLIEAKPEVGRAALLAAAPRMKNAFEQRRARLSDHHTPYDGVLPPGVAQLRERFFSDDRQLSASAVGTYAACPQKFFLGNFLGLRKIEEPESIINISALDRGTLIHRILERFLKEEPAKGEER